MTTYRIGGVNLDLEVIGVGHQGGNTKFSESFVWELNLKQLRDLAAFAKAGWRFQKKATHLDWNVFNKNGPFAPGLLALYPTGGLVILRDRLVLQFRPDIGAEKVMDLLGSYSSFRALSFGDNLFEVVLQPPPDNDLESHIYKELNDLLKSPEVVFAEPSLLYYIGNPEPTKPIHVENLEHPRIRQDRQPVTSDDTLDGSKNKWHWYKIDLLEAWKAGDEQGKGEGKGKGRRVAVIDEGFHADDPQIKDGIDWKITLDSEGVIITNNHVPEHYHGTMCAGLIGAAHDKEDVNGAAPSCRLGLVALGNFCVCSQVALGIALQICADMSELTKNVLKGREADVISCSLGIGASNWVRSGPLGLAIDRVVNKGRDGKGTPIVWATYDSNDKIEPWALEGYGPLIIVSRSDEDDARIESGWGDGLDLIAPGQNVTVILWDAKDGRLLAPQSGSSLAAPCVAGVAALVLAVNPNLTCKQVADVLTKSCDPVNGQTGWNEEVGSGRLNARKAVERALAMLKQSQR